MFKEINQKNIKNSAHINITTSACSWNKISGSFISTAYSLPEHEILGLTICPNNGAFSLQVFSGIEMKPEDYNWIFDNSHEINMVPFSEMEISKNHNEYVLIPCLSNSADTYKPDYYIRAEYIKEFVKMMVEIEASVHFVFRSCKDNGGNPEAAILLSTSEIIPQRMRTLIISLCRHTVSNYITYASENVQDVFQSNVNMNTMYDNIKAILKQLPKIQQTNEPLPPTKVDGEKDLILTPSAIDFDIDKYNQNTPIDQLRLSIRSTNALLRSNITTLGQLSDLNREELCKIRNLGMKCVNEIENKLKDICQNKKKSPQTDSKTGTEMLNELIGLGEVKEQVKKLTAFGKMQKDLAETGRNFKNFSFNMIFSGNPGTAKTTVARIMGKIFFENGLISVPEIVEAGRSDIIAEYSGQTAIKVKKLFNKAQGKILFIDEAYSLIDDYHGSYGNEAINTIVQEMENRRGETIVIFAGYSKEMQEFLNKNQGLKSRIPFTVHFEDYSLQELIQLSEFEAEKRGFSISQEAISKLKNTLSKAKMLPDFGNGRFCRNLIENSIISYASRVYDEDNGNADNDFTLLSEDITCKDIERNIEKIKMNKIIGFCA